jgi:hypothetical protein
MTVGLFSVVVLLPMTSSGGTTTAIAKACETLKDLIGATHGDAWIRENLNVVWIKVSNYVEEAGDLNLQKHLRNYTEFCFYCKLESKGERELLNLIKRMVKKRCPG